MIRFHATARLMHMGLLLGLVGLWSLFAVSWVPLAILVPLLGVFLFALFESLLPLPMRALRRVEPSGSLLLQDEALVRVLVPPTPAPYNLIVEDPLPDGLRVVPGSRTPFGMHKKSLVARYKVRAQRRGDYRFDTVRIRRSSMLGLFERSVDLPVPTQVSVLPVTAENMNIKLRPRPLQRTGMPTSTMRRGPGDEFFSLRPYQPGDNIGDVNWKATARMNRIITNEFLPEEPPRYLIYVDARSTASEKGEPDVFERSLELAHILIEALIQARAHVGMALLSYHSQLIVPASGQNQLNRLRDMIKGAQPGQYVPLHGLVMAGLGHLPQSADAVVVTANVYDTSLPEALGLLRARHKRVVLLAPGYPEPVGQTLDLAARRASGAILNAEQANTIESMVGLVDASAQWLPDEPLTVTLSRLGMTRGYR